MVEYKEINFSSYQLFIDEVFAELKILDVNEAWNEDYEDNRKTVHSIRCNIINDRYFTLYDNFGSPIPRPDKIYDVPTKTRINNPRKDSQAELRNQLFCLYDTNSNILYMNNSKKKKFVSKYISKKISKDVIIKNIYKNIDEFTKTLKTLNKIQFIAHRNLFTSQVDSFRNIKDLFGIDEPESFSLEAKYNISVEEKIRRTIESFKKEQAKIPNSCLTCIGKDDNGIEQIFNENAFCRSISIMLQQNNEKLFNTNEVFEQLIRKIENNV